MEVKCSIFGIIDPYDYSYSPAGNFRIKPKDFDKEEEYNLCKLKIFIEDIDYENIAI